MKFSDLFVKKPRSAPTADVNHDRAIDLLRTRTTLQREIRDRLVCISAIEKELAASSTSPSL